MFRHLKCHPQGAHCALLKLHTEFLVVVKKKLLKYKMIKSLSFYILTTFFNKTRKSLCNFSKAQWAS